MDCQQAEQWLSRYHDGELSSDDRTELEVHLESCPQCSVQLADIRSLSQAARNLAVVRPPHDLWDRIQWPRSNCSLRNSRERRLLRTRRKNLSAIDLATSNRRPLDSLVTNWWSWTCPAVNASKRFGSVRTIHTLRYSSTNQRWMIGPMSDQVRISTAEKSNVE